MNPPQRNCAPTQANALHRPPQKVHAGVISPGTEAKLQRFILATYGIVLAFLLRRVGDRQTAEDLTQETFIAVLHPDFDPDRADALGFLKQKAIWLAKELRRRLARTPKSLPPEVADPRACMPGQALEHEEDRDLARRQIVEAIDSLAARDKDLFLDYYVRGSSFADLALSIGLAQQTVRGLVSRAKKAVLARLCLHRITNSITNSQMKTLATFAAAATTSNPEAVSATPVRSEDETMSTASSNRDGNPIPARSRFRKPDKVERDTLLSRRRALRTAIKHLLGCRWNPDRHDQMMCVLTNRGTGRISESECDRRWAAFTKEFGLDE